ncbi:MAG TPA: hypothetical protein VEC57_15110 [Candidatus Limnocylindrales bacterium]|nr:hypothetical protein [Candidatus Limnocylindrales bacterium]
MGDANSPHRNVDKNGQYLEYPRMLHKAGGKELVVANDAECDAARKQGWSLEPIVDEPQAEAADASPAADDKPKKGAKK